VIVSSQSDVIVTWPSRFIWRHFRSCDVVVTNILSL